MRAIACGLVLLAASGGSGSVLLRDEFDGAALDAENWFVPEGPGTFLGRTQLRPPSEPPVIANGAARLRLDTFNPDANTPGDSFWGAEIASAATFARGSGLRFRARVRLVGPVPGGLVASLFSYRLAAGGGARDEIDAELLSNDVVAGRERFLTNAFDDDDFSQPGDALFADVPGLDLTQWNEFEVVWLPDRVRWLANGQLVREELDTVPDADMNVRLNFWAPAESFADAYDAALVPASSPQQNQTWFYEVDFVEVRRIPGLPALPPAAFAALAGALAAAGSLASRRIADL